VDLKSHYDNSRIPALREGLRLPGTTTILEIKSDKELLRMYGSLGTRTAEYLISQAGIIGTYAHRHANAYFDESVSFDWLEAKEDKEQNEKLKVAVKNFYEFCKVYKPTPLLLETPVYSLKHKYAGTLDGVFVIDGRIVVLDWKTSAKLKRVHRLQINAYFYALLEMVEKKLLEVPGLLLSELQQSELWIVQLPKKQPIKFERDIKKITPSKKEFDVFLSALRIYNWDTEEAYAI